MSPLRARYSSAAVCALIVMPRSRSRSIESSTCSAISRSASPPHIWMKRSASVDLPWSMCAMMEKLRILVWDIEALRRINKEGAPLGHPPLTARYSSLERNSALVGEPRDRHEGGTLAAPHLECQHGTLVEPGEHLVELVDRLELGLLALVDDHQQHIAFSDVDLRVGADIGH